MQILGKRSGIALLTGLFTVMVLYLLATVVMQDTLQNFSFTRYGDIKIQARFVSQGAVNQALHDMNSDNSWVSVHNASNPYTFTAPDYSIRAWAVPIANSAPLIRYYLIAQGNVSGQVEQSNTIVLQRPNSIAFDYGLRNMESNNINDVLYASNSTNGGNWTLLPLSPGLYWDSVGVAKVNTYADGAVSYTTFLSQVAGDSQGGVYTIWTPSAFNHQTHQILRFDNHQATSDPANTTSPWQLLPLINNTATSPSFQNIVGLSVNDERDIVAQCRLPDGSDRIAHLDLTTMNATLNTLPPLNFTSYAGNWTILPVPPHVHLNTDSTYNQVSGNITDGNFTDVVVDNSNHVYAVWSNPNFNNGDGPFVVYRYQALTDGSHDSDWSGGTWQVLPAPLKQFWNWDTATNTPIGYGPEVTSWANNLQYAAVDPLTSDFFGRWNRNTSPAWPPNNIDTIYHFIAKVVPGPPSVPPTPFTVGGQWHPNPLPPPTAFWDPTGKTKIIGKGALPGLNHNAVDQASRFLGDFPNGAHANPSEDPDTVYTYNLEGPTTDDWTALPAIPNSYYIVQANPPHAAVNVTKNDYTPKLGGLAGGGYPGSQKYKFVPMSSF